MKVLIVDAFSGSRSGRHSFAKFDEIVRRAFQVVERFEQGRTEFVVRHFSNGLQDLCYDNEDACSSSKTAIAEVDKLDFIFVDGDSRLLPWHPRTRKLVVFLRTVIGAKKCLFAAGPGAHVVSYVCAMGGKPLSVLNGGGNGGSLLELSSLRPEDLGGSDKPMCGGEAKEVVLDAATGDFYVFNFKMDRWVAEGNVGIQKSCGGIGGVAAAILADAAGGQGHGCEQKFPVNELLGVRRSIQSAADISSKTLQRPKTPRFQSEVLVRVRPKSIQHRFLKHVHCGEFLAWSPGKWSIGEATAARCRQTFTVLAASNRAGPEVVEIGNCLATRFNVRHGYQHSTHLLQAFVEDKHILIRDENRIDRGSEFVMNGMQTADDFDGMSVRSSHKQAAAAAEAATGYESERRSSRQRLPQDNNREATTTPCKRTVPFPRRPQPAEKPRFAQPQCTRAIRVSSATSERRGRTKDNDPSVLVGNAACIGGEATGGERGGDDSHCGARATRMGDDVDTGVHGGGGQRQGGTTAADPVGRRRVLMARMGEGLGLDLSPAIDALLHREEHLRKTTGESTLPRGTEDVVDRRHDEQGKIKRQQEQCCPHHDTSGGSAENGTTRTRDDDMLSRVRSPENTSEPASCNRSRKARSVAGGGGERRRDVAMGSVVRVPGQERRRPYNSFHRFRKMERETRNVFFSLGCGSGSGKGCKGIAGKNKVRDTSQGAGADGNAINVKRFSANFGRKEAWTPMSEPEIRTQGPYLGKNGCASSTKTTTSLNPRRLLTNPKRWRFSGSKTRGWSGIGEGTGFTRGPF